MTIPDSVTKIGSLAFAFRTSLTNVTIPGSVTSIEIDAFLGCTGLTSVTIPDNVTSIGDGAFSNCTGLTAFQVDSNNQNYTSVDGVLYSKDRKTLIIYPAGKSGAYTVPDSVTSIGDLAFSYCTGLTSITIPDSVTSIGGSVFNGCTSLTSVTIPDSVTSIEDKVFFGCTGLTSMTIPDNVTSIGNSAFSGCAGLTSVTIGGGSVSIGERAFFSCWKLASVTVSGSVTSVKAEAFFNTAWLRNQTDFAILGGYLLEYRGEGGDVVIPAGVTEIGAHAFASCTGLTSVTIPSSVTSIENYAFSDCTGLTSVAIPASVTSIGTGAFLKTPWLESQGEFAIVNGILLKYQSSSGDVVIPNGVTNIGGGAFWDCTGLTSVTIPNSVTRIGDYAFCGCTGLTSVTIPYSVTDIGRYAFYGCTGLTDVYYGGTEAQWKAIDNKDDNAPLEKATIHYNSAGPDQPQQPAQTAAAEPTNDSLLVDGAPAEPAAYKIDGSNYFKLRDVAALLNGTPKQFNVGYDSATQSATITTGQGYAKTSTDLQGKPSAGGTATISNNKIFINGKESSLTVYKINGSNYFKLRDLGKALNFNVGWSKDKGMYIEGSKSYTDAD